MPDNRKPLIYGAFPVCRNYTVRAQLRHDRAAMRRGRKNSLHDARSQQRGIYTERLHALDQLNAAGSSANRRKRNAKDARALKTAKTNSRLPEKQPGFSFSSHFVQPDTFRPIAVGVRVGVNVAEWRTSAQVALTLRRGRQPRETKKNQACLRKNTPRRQSRFFFKKFG